MNARKARVFKWSQRKGWERVFRNLLADKINDAIIAKIQRINPRCVAGDSFEWLNSVVATHTEQSEDIPPLLAQRLAGYYEFVTVFHATRSNSAVDFIEHGIKLSDIDALNLQAEKLFGKSDELQAAIAAIHFCKEHDHGKIFFFLKKIACLKEHPSFLRQGCEHLAAIAVRLGKIEMLKSRGKPFIVECLVPANMLEPEFWIGRSFAMLEDFFSRLLRPYEQRRIQSSCAIATQPIHSDNILRVHEFKEVKRPFKWNDFRTNEVRHDDETLFRPLKIWTGKAHAVKRHAEIGGSVKSPKTSD